MNMLLTHTVLNLSYTS